MPTSLPPYITYLLAAIAAAAISIYGVRKTIFITRNRKLYDKPDDIRKIHGAEIPSLGGIGIFMGYIVVAAFFWRGDSSFMPFFMASTAILLFTGIYDDIMNMRPSKKLVAQLLASFITIYFAQVGDLSDILFGTGTLPHWAGIIFTTLCCTFFINVFNFIDGIDGLACSLAILYFTLLGWLFTTIHMDAMAGVAFALIGSTVGLLIFNIAPAKIYMGDTGSMFLGFSIFIFSLLFIDRASNPGMAITGSLQYVHGYQEAVMLIIAMLFVPIFDALRVFALRMSRGISPLRADRTHLHYYLLDAGFTHSQAVMVIVGTNIVTMAVAYALQDRSIMLIACAITVPSIIVLLIVYRLRQKKLRLKN